MILFIADLRTENVVIGVPIRHRRLLTHENKRRLSTKKKARLMSFENADY